MSQSRSCFQTIQYSKDSWKCPKVVSVSAVICPSPISSLKWNSFHCTIVELVNSGEGRQSAPERNQFLPPIKLQTRKARSADNLVIFLSHWLATHLATYREVQDSIQTIYCPAVLFYCWTLWGLATLQRMGEGFKPRELEVASDWKEAGWAVFL